MLKFHWRLVQRGEGGAITRAIQAGLPPTALPDLETQTEFCRRAEESGIDGLLVDLNFGTPEPLLLALALASRTEKIRFIVAARSASLCPTLFVQQVNTFSSLANGRIILNIVAGHSPDEQKAYGDFLDHDARYARTVEFLEVCRGFWRDAEVDFEGRHYRIVKGKLKTPFVAPDRQAPEIFIAGGSEPARHLAVLHGDVWMRLADTPQAVAESVLPVLRAGKECGLRLSLIPGATRAEALDAARSLVEDARGNQDRRAEDRFVRNSDSRSISAVYEAAEREWLAPALWTGAVRTHGAPAIALVGSYEEIASAILGYAQAGVGQFIFSGWPKLETMVRFGREILPRIRERETGLATPAQAEAR